MILPENYIWEQLDGPQITAIRRAIYEWCVDQTAPYFNYFNNLAIDTANSEHLSYLGILAGVPRPVINHIDLTLFYFTEHLQTNFIYGFSSLADIGVGGRVTELGQVYDTTSTILLPDEPFRCILKAYADSEGEIGSLRMLDDILDALRQLFGSTAVYDFNIRTTATDDRLPGDIEISLDDSTKWNQPEAIIEALRAIANTLYNPDPRLFVSFSDA